MKPTLTSAGKPTTPDRSVRDGFDHIVGPGIAAPGTAIIESKVLGLELTRLADLRIMGVRGLVADIHPPTIPGEGRARSLMVHRSEVARELKLFKQGLQQLGVFRAHAFLPADVTPQELKFWQSHGFKENVTPLFTRDLSRDGTPPMLPPRALIDAVAIGAPSEGHLDTIIPILKDEPAVAFLEWESNLLRPGKGHPNLYMRVMTLEDQCVGIAIGGRHGDVATVTHFFIVPEARGLKLGKWFAHSVLTDFQEQGAKKVYVMAGEDYPKATGFWQAMRFRESPHKSLYAKVSQEV